MFDIFYETMANLIIMLLLRPQIFCPVEKFKCPHQKRLSINPQRHEILHAHIYMHQKQNMCILVVLTQNLSNSNDLNVLRMWKFLFRTFICY